MEVSNVNGDVSKPLMTKYMRYEIADGILVCRYEDNVEVDLDVAKQLVQDRLAVSNNVPMCILIDGRNLKSMNKEARDYLSSDEGSNGVVASALLTDSVFTRFLANFFMKVNVINPPFPVKLFTSEQPAVDWLKRNYLDG